MDWPQQFRLKKLPLLLRTINAIEQRLIPSLAGHDWKVSWLDPQYREELCVFFVAVGLFVPWCQLSAPCVWSPYRIKYSRMVGYDTKLNGSNHIVIVRQVKRSRISQQVLERSVRNVLSALLVHI
jgi:hypothetical protein